MALRRSGPRFTANIWPGFVDAMTALLLVLMFVLTIFMIVQFVLRETITGQDEELNALSLEISGLAEALGLEQQRAAGLEDDVDQLNSTLADAARAADAQSDLITSLTAQTEAQQSSIESFEAQVASLLAQNSDLTANLTNAQNQIVVLSDQAESLRTDLANAQGVSEGLEQEKAQLLASIADLEAANLKAISQQEATQLALAKARDEIDAQAEQARLAAAKRESMEALIANLRNNIATKTLSLEEALGSLMQAQAALKDTTAELNATQQSRDTLQAQLSDTTETLTQAQQDLQSSQSQLSETTLTAEALEARIAELLRGISEEEKAKLAEAAAAEALRASLQDADAELTAMALALEEKRQEAEDTLTLLAAARAAKDKLQSDLDTELTEKEQRALLLAQANATLADERAVSAESLRKLEVLNLQSAELRKQLNVLQGLLDAAQERDAEAQVQIETLGSNLNVALAQAAVEQRKRAELEAAERARLEAESKDLKQFKSEFFGRIRGILEGREGVKLVGDRFVFSSEVLFSAGSAELGEGGKREVAKVAALIREIADKIPDEIDWILRVDGHTDNVPLSGQGLYRNNWELSQARALSVVRYLNEFLGIPANRLAANGFGEHQPIATGNSARARATNRRIELKFTEK